MKFFLNENQNRVGILFSFIVFIGCILKKFNLPGANIILIIGFFGFLFNFIPYLIYLQLKENKFIETLALFFFNTLMLGLFFKIMKWPFVVFLTSWSLGISVFVIVPFYLLINYFKKTDENFSKDDRKKNIIQGALYFILISSLYLII